MTRKSSAAQLAELCERAARGELTLDAAKLRAVAAALRAAAGDRSAGARRAENDARRNEIVAYLLDRRAHLRKAKVYDPDGTALAEAAEHFNLSESTIEGHREQFMKRLRRPGD